MYRGRERKKGFPHTHTDHVTHHYPAGRYFPHIAFLLRFFFAFSCVFLFFQSFFFTSRMCALPVFFCKRTRKKKTSDYTAVSGPLALRHDHQHYYCYYSFRFVYVRSGQVRSGQVRQEKRSVVQLLIFFPPCCARTPILRNARSSLACI